MAIEPDFGVNNFNKPKMFSESETLVNNLLMLLFMRPGSYPSLPNLGIDIEQYLYMFFDEINTEKIKYDIAAQCVQFLDAVEAGSLDVQKILYKKKPLLLIVLPVRIEENVTGLKLALTLNDANNVFYNFEYDNTII